MSINVYSRGLWWNGERGVIRDVEFTIQLAKAPSIMPGVVEIDYGEVELGKLAYNPEIRLGGGSRRREMEAGEIQLVDLWLMELRDEVLAAVRNPHPHQHITVEFHDEKPSPS